MVRSWHLHVKAPLAPCHTRRASTDVQKEVFFNHFFGVVWSVSVAVFAAVVAAPSKAVLTPYLSSTETAFDSLSKGSSGEPRAVGLNEAWEYQFVYWKT